VYLFDFQSKLAKLNPNLYVNTKEVRHIRGDWHSTGIYLRNSGGRKGRTSTGRAYVSAAASKLLEDTMAGRVDKYIGPVPASFVPEYDVFHFDKFGEGRISAVGWRTILCNLVRKGLLDSRKTKKIFDCRGLGESTYDRSSGSQKMATAKETK